MFNIVIIVILFIYVRVWFVYIVIYIFSVDIRIILFIVRFIGFRKICFIRYGLFFSNIRRWRFVFGIWFINRLIVYFLYFN